MSEPLFYFGAMSPYSWFAAERIGTLVPQARWRPVFAGGLFAAVGRSSWGLSDQRGAKLADCEARAAAHGLGPIVWPDEWPRSDIAVARAMAVADREGRLQPFALAAMRAAFRDGADLADVDVLIDIARTAGLSAGSALPKLLSERSLKDVVRETNDAAVAAGVVGVPTVVVNGTLFWGDDRLDEAAAAVTGAS